MIAIIEDRFEYNDRLAGLVVERKRAGSSAGLSQRLTVMNVESAGPQQEPRHSIACEVKVNYAALFLW